MVDLRFNLSSASNQYTFLYVRLWYFIGLRKCEKFVIITCIECNGFQEWLVFSYNKVSPPIVLMCNSQVRGALPITRQNLSDNQILINLQPVTWDTRNLFNENQEKSLKASQSENNWCGKSEAGDNWLHHGDLSCSTRAAAPVTGWYTVPIVASSDFVVYIDDIDLNNWWGGNNIELRSYSKKISNKI